MTELRWILLGLGLLVIGAVWLLWGRKLGLPGRSQPADTPERREPSLSARDSDDEAFARLIGAEQRPVRTSTTDDGTVPGDDPGALPVDRDPTSGPVATPAPATGQAVTAGPQKVVALHVAARRSERFRGVDLVAALQAAGLEHGQYDIFHRASGDSAAPLFSAASMVEPGSFDMERIGELSTPGLTLFLVLPGPADGAVAFSEMLGTARALAQRLGGEVLDEGGSSLSNQTAGHLREEIVAFELRRRALDEMPG